MNIFPYLSVKETLSIFSPETKLVVPIKNITELALDDLQQKEIGCFA